MVWLLGCFRAHRRGKGAKTGLTGPEKYLKQLKDKKIVLIKVKMLYLCVVCFANICKV